MGWQDDPVIGSGWQNDPVVGGASTPQPKKIGKDAFLDDLRDTVKNADWFTRNLAGFGTAASDLYEGAKQLVGQGDLDQIKANKVIQDEAPVGSVAGNLAMTAIPFGMAGNSVNAAAKIGTVMGALNPVASDKASDIVGGKILGAATGGATAALGQAGANKVGDFFAQQLATRQLQKSINAPLDKTLQDATDAGLVFAPSDVSNTVANRLRDSIGGKAATRQAASAQNVETVGNMVRRLMGMDETAPLTSEAMQAIRRNAYDTGYGPIARAGEMPVSEQYKQALDSIAGKYVDASESFPGVRVPDIEALVNSFKPPASPYSPEALRQQAMQTVDGLINKTGQSRTFALQEAGKLQTEAAQAASRANNFVPVPGMPRVPASLSPNNELAAAYQAAVPDALAAMESRTAANQGLRGLQEQLQGAGALPNSSFDAAHALTATQALRNLADESFRAGKGQLGRAQKAIANEIENEVERQLTAQGASGQQMLQQFRNARKQIAMSHDIEDAIREGGGNLDARVLARKLQAGEPLSDELRVIAAAANNFPHSFQPASQVGGAGVSKVDALLAAAAAAKAGAGATAGGVVAGPVGAALGAAAPFLASALARSRALSSGVQNSLVRDYGLTAPEVLAGRVVKYLPAASAVASRNALLQYLAP